MTPEHTSFQTQKTCKPCTESTWLLQFDTKIERTLKLNSQNLESTTTHVQQHVRGNERAFAQENKEPAIAQEDDEPAVAQENNEPAVAQEDDRACRRTRK